jgi:hypothetical protein
MNRLGLLAPLAFVASTFVPAAAHALTLNTVGVTSTGTRLPIAPISPTVAPIEIVTDLGDYDPQPVAHLAYGAIRVPLDGLLVSTGDFTPACPTPQTTYDWDRVASKADDFGNDTFGAGYWAGLTFSSRAGRAGGPDSFSGEGLLRGYVTVFSSNHELARISGKASLTGSQGLSSYYVRVLGVDVRSRSVSGNLSGNESLYDASFFEASKTIWLGPLPVKFTGAIRGQLGITYNAQYASSTLSVEAKPNANLYAFASAGIDVWLASAGVSGSLSLIQASVPAKASAVVQPNAVAYSLDSDLTLTSLSGEIDAYAKIPGHKWTTRLAKWDPVYQGTYPIVHLHSCQNPIVRPVCGDGVCQSGETSYNCSNDCGAPPPPPPDDDPLSPLCMAKPWMCEAP